MEGWTDRPAGGSGRRYADECSAGNRQVVFVTGEAGIGKSTFIEMAMERLARQGVDVLCGRCTERFGTDEAFHPLIDALMTRCRGSGGPAVLEAIRAHAPTWLLQMPSFVAETDRAAFQNEVFGATRERMLREFCDLVEVLSADRPLAIVLEDLHWSDFATLDVLSRFARGDRRASVLLLASYRPSDTIVAGHPIRRLHQDLEIHGRSTELRLEPLSRAEVRAPSRPSVPRRSPGFGPFRAPVRPHPGAATIRGVPSRLLRQSTRDLRSRWRLASGFRDRDCPECRAERPDQHDHSFSR